MPRASTHFPTSLLPHPQRLCLLKGGLVYANRVVTVSPTYALEASAGGAAGFLRSTLARPDVAAKFGGVLNGIDVDMWDPRSDGLIAAPYGVGAMAGKALNKKFLQMGLGLKVDPAAPLVVCVTRLVPQKGIHLIKRAIYRTAERGGQAVLLGTGHADGEFKAMAQHDFAGSDAVKLMLTYSEPLAHALYAAADVVLVPSLFEPCGLTQMIGLRYGAVPLVRRTGGLADTVHDTGPRANGFVFEGTDDAAVASCVDDALDAWWMDRDRFEELRARGMSDDVSWGASADSYLAFYAGEVTREKCGAARLRLCRSIERKERHRARRGRYADEAVTSASLLSPLNPGPAPSRALARHLPPAMSAGPLSSAQNKCTKLCICWG